MNTNDKQMRKDLCANLARYNALIHAGKARGEHVRSLVIARNRTVRLLERLS